MSLESKLEERIVINCFVVLSSLF